MTDIPRASSRRVSDLPDHDIQVAIIEAERARTRVVDKRLDSKDVMTAWDFAQAAQDYQDMANACMTLAHKMYVGVGPDDVLSKPRTRLRDLPLPPFGIRGMKGP